MTDPENGKPAAATLEPEGEQREPVEGEDTSDETEQPDETGAPGEPDERETLAFEGRCEAVTTVGGGLYQCALEQGHEGEHSFQSVQLADPEGEPVQPTAASRQAQVDAQAKKLDRATDTYSKKVVEILGDDLSGFIGCELCEPFYPGLRLPVPLKADQLATLRVLIGLPALANFAQDRYSKVCDDCNGLGKVLTGSNVEQYRTVQCLGCRGKGWVPVGDERRVQAIAQPDEPAPVLEGETEASPDVDPWGRPKGDPDYGRLPGYEA